MSADLQYSQAPPPHDGDTVCTGCGRVLDPLQTMLTTTGRCWACDRAWADKLKRNRMVSPADGTTGRDIMR